jgi:hypothetical protein
MKKRDDVWKSFTSSKAVKKYESNDKFARTWPIREGLVWKDTRPVEEEPCDVHPELGGQIDSNGSNNSEGVIKEVSVNDMMLNMGKSNKRSCILVDPSPEETHT